MKKFTLSDLNKMDSIEFTTRYTQERNGGDVVNKYVVMHSKPTDYPDIYYVYLIDRKVVNGGKITQHDKVNKPYGKANVPSYTLFVPFSEQGGYRILAEHVLKDLNLIKEGFDTKWDDFDWKVVSFKVNDKETLKARSPRAPRRSHKKAGLGSLVNSYKKML